MTDPTIQQKEPSANPSRFASWAEMLNGALGRSIGQYILGAGTVITGLGLADAETVQNFVTGAQEMFDGIKVLIGGLSKFLPAAGIILASILAFGQSLRGTPAGKLAAVSQISQKEGIAVVVADNSKLAPLAVGLPNTAVTIAPPDRQAIVSVPQPAVTEQRFYG